MHCPGLKAALKVIGIVILVGSAWGVLAAKTARGQSFQEYLLSWIPPSCCVTNQCCWKISERDLTSLPDDKWQVNSTGQVLKRTDYSPDGEFYRCACDYDPASGQWIKHQGAHTRCIFTPMLSG